MKNIKVMLAYHGEEGIVPQGIYSPEDARLLGLADYLLSAGHAKRSDEVEMPVEPSITHSNELQLKIHAGRVIEQNGELVTTRLEPALDRLAQLAPPPDGLINTSPSPDVEVESLSDLRNRYKELAGKGASPKWDADTLREKIKALEDAESDNEGL